MNVINLPIIVPFDAHLHLRQDDLMRSIFLASVKHIDTAVAMGNLNPPVDNLDALKKYKAELEGLAVENSVKFTPIIAIMLTENTTVETIRQCAPYAKVLKFIPGNTSTNSKGGVALESLEESYPILEEVRRQGMIFAIHAERIMYDDGQSIPESIREIEALPYVAKLIADMPDLKIVIEHVSTQEACKLVLQSPDNVAATITAHHPYFNDEYLYSSEEGQDYNPFFYCKPVLKGEKHRNFVAQMMLSGSKKFFFGSDSAAHPMSTKTGEKINAGIFSAPVALPLIAQIFFRANKLDLLEDFVSINGRNFYGLEIPKQKIVLTNNPNLRKIVPQSLGKEEAPILMAGKKLYWTVQ